MTKMKRKLAFTVAIGLAASMALSSCGGGGSAASSNAAGANKSATTAASGGSGALAPYEINWYIEGNGQPPDTARIMAAANELLKPINATLNMHVISWGDWNTKTTAMTASSDYYDILFTANWNQFASQVAQNIFLNLDDLYQKYGQNIINDCGMDMLNRIKVGGHWYSVPVNKDNFTGYGFAFNQKILDEHGWKISDLKSIEDLTPWFAEVQKSDPGIQPFGMAVGNNFIMDIDCGDITGTTYVPLGMYDDNRSKEITFLFDSKWVQYELELTRQWYQAGYINPNAPQKTDTTLQTQQGDGTVFCFEQPLKPGKDGEISNAKVTYTQWLISDYFAHAPFGAMQSISKTSKDPARCMMFLNMLYGDASKDKGSLLNLLTFGQEGKDYTFAPDGRVQLVANPGWNFNMPWMLGNQLNQMLLTTQPADEYTQIAKVNKSCHPTYFDSFLLDPSNINTQMAAITNATTPLIDPLLVGAVDVKPTIDKIREAANAAGLEAVKAELQKQLDAYINNNAQPYKHPFNASGQY